MTYITLNYLYCDTNLHAQNATIKLFVEFQVLTITFLNNLRTVVS